MPNIPGTVIAAKVTTGNTANSFPVADQNEVQGGHHSVQSLVERDAITDERRKEGMTVYVADTQQVFQLIGGTANGDWVDQATAAALQLYQTTVLAWTGTATGDTALNIACTGTNAAVAGIDLANEVLLVAQGGTAQAQDAYNLAELAYDLASQNPAQPGAGNWLLSGGQVVWVSGYDFQVGPTVVSFGGTAVSFGSESFTLSPADLVDSRLDLIVADRTYGTIAVIEGTASTPAYTPEYDPVNQFELTFIPVDANTSQPGDVDIQWIYRENTEWTLAGSVGPYVNVNSTTDPYSGVKCIEVTNANTNTTIRYQAAADFEVNNYSTLFLYLKPKTAWGNNFVRIDFERTNGNMFGKYVVIKHGFLGFDANNLNYQLIAIPISLFSVPTGSAVRGIRFNCQNFSGPQNWRLDDIGLQLGVASAPTNVPDATTTVKGIVQLEQDGGTLPGRAVTGDDYRLALATTGTNLAYTALQQAWYGTQAAGDIGYPALVTAWVGTATANVALGVATTGTNSFNYETGTRSQQDQVLQNQINALNSILGISLQGTCSLYMASFRNGPPDTKVTIINGVVTGQVPPIYVWEDFELYPTGTLPPLTYGSAFAGQGTITGGAIAAGLVAEDQITYGTGTLYTATNPAGTVFVNQGTGWTSNGTVSAIYWSVFGTDTLETYSYGTFGTNSSTGFITGPSPINQGIGWAGTATVIMY